MPRRRQQSEGPSLAGLAGLTVGLPIVYLAAEGALPGNRHPIHWVLAAAGGGLGYIIGDLIARMRERRVHPGTYGRRDERGRSASSRRNRPRQRRR